MPRLKSPNLDGGVVSKRKPDKLIALNPTRFGADILFDNLKKSIGRKSDSVNIDFDPELSMFAVKSIAGHKDGEKAADTISIRVASGDEGNNHKNIKVQANDIKEMSFVIKGFDELSADNTKGVKTIRGTAVLSLVRIVAGEPITEEVLLADHVVAVHGQKIKTGSFEWPTTESVKKEINAIWQEIFAESLDGYLSDSEHNYVAKDNYRTDSGGAASVWIMRISIAIIIASLLVTIGVVLLKKSKVAGVNESIIDQYSLGDGAKNPQLPAPTETESADAEAMKEFGLDSGIKLD